MLLGRVTYQEMEGWFVDQTPVVVTRNPKQVDVPNGHAVDSLDAAIALAKEHKAEELVISGGATIYQKGIHLADTLVLTRILSEIEGQKKFPEFEKTDWSLSNTEEWPADDQNTHSMRLETWEKRL